MNNAKQQTNKVKLKEKEISVLLLLYRFRFLNRSQIQVMMNHKYRRRVQEWLNNLVVQDCIKQDYSKDFAGRSAIYSLAPLGRKQLKDNPKVKTKLLDSRVWREQERTQEFQEHCLFVANTYLSLIDFAAKVGSVLHFYVKTDLYGKPYIVRPNPDAYFALESAKGNNKRYYLDYFDDVPSAQLRRRVLRYLDYYDTDKWSKEYPDKPFPDIILICPNIRIKGHLNLYIQNKIDEYEEMGFYLTTKDQVKEKGITRETIERVMPAD